MNYLSIITGLSITPLAIPRGIKSQEPPKTSSHPWESNPRPTVYEARGWRVARRVFALGRRDFGSGVKPSNGQSASNDWPVWDGSHGCSPARTWVTINPSMELRVIRGAS